MKMEMIETTGEGLGWIYKHRSVAFSTHEIRLSGGTVVISSGDREIHNESNSSFILDIQTKVWTKNGGADSQ
jgi:hypothetical protein